jgi:hypothetical protein
MATIPSLALIPSGYKGGSPKGTLYSVLPTDGTGDFDFTRSGNATRINKEGLIEVVGNNVPRLNYPLIDGVVSGCPSLLLEPERTNNVLYSQEVNNDYWIKSNCIITPNTHISPDGTLNADTLTSSAGNAVLYRTSVITGSLSFFAKDINLTTGNFVISVDTIGSANWDKNGNLVSVSGGTASNGVDYGNGWFRFSYNVTSGSVVNYGISNGSGNESILVFGLQNEPSALYSTSYIPTTTTTATRSAETCNNAGDANTFNDSEGVLFAEISGLAETNLFEAISVNDNSLSDRIFIGYFSDDLYITVVDGGQAKYDVNTPINIKQNNKIAVKYKAQDFSFYLNGFEINSSSGINGGTTPSGLANLSFDRGDGVENFYGNTKQIQYFPTALNDSDLETLTSWDSFSDMATSQLYIIE